MNRACQIVLFVTLMVLPIELASAQSTEDQYWPEVDPYLRVNQKPRLSFFAIRSTDGNNYDSRHSAWSKSSYSHSGEIPLGRRMQVETYFEHDNQIQTLPQHVNAPGLELSLYF